MHPALTDPINLTSLDDALAYCGVRIAQDLAEQAARSDADAAAAAGVTGGPRVAAWLAQHRPDEPELLAAAA